MVEIKLEWRHWSGQYTDREDLYLGKWKVGSAFFNGTRPKDDPLTHSSTCHLPGLKEDLGHYATLSEAQVRVESAVRHWLAKAGIAEVS
jgi:hypothetical protein